jgi:hypothetical protein
LASEAIDYLSVGATALLPFGILWTLSGALVAVAGSMGRPLQKRLAAIRTRIRTPRRSIDGVTIATFVLVAGFVGWLAAFWLYFDVFLAIQRLTQNAQMSAAELLVLGSAGSWLHRTHYMSSIYLSLLLAVAVWRWFPQCEQHTAEPATVRGLKWATVLVIALVVVTATAPRRFVWENFEVVKFDNSPAFVIGSSSDELLLYYPYSNTSKHRRVRTDAPELQRTGTQARLFDPE